MRMALFALVLVIGISFVVSAVKIVQLQGEKKEVAAKNDELTHKKKRLRWNTKMSSCRNISKIRQDAT